AEPRRPQRAVPRPLARAIPHRARPPRAHRLPCLLGRAGRRRPRPGPLARAGEPAWGVRRVRARPVAQPQPPPPPRPLAARARTAAGPHGRSRPRPHLPARACEGPALTLHAPARGPPPPAPPRP